MMSGKRCSRCGGAPVKINYRDEPHWYCDICETLEPVEVTQ